MFKSKVKKLSALVLSVAMMTGTIGVTVVSADAQEQHPNQIQQPAPNNQQQAPQKKHKKDKPSQQVQQPSNNQQQAPQKKDKKDKPDQQIQQKPSNNQQQAPQKKHKKGESGQQSVPAQQPQQ